MNTTEKEQQRARKKKPEIRYSETGNSFSFDSSVDALQVDLVGPFESTTSLTGEFTPQTQTERILVRSDLLGLGLDQATALSLRAWEYKMENKEFEKKWFRSSSRPYSEDVITAYHKQRGSFAYTEAEERATAASFVAYNEFFEIAAKTPALRKIFLEVANVSPMRLILGGNFNTLQRMVPWKTEIHSDLEISGADSVYSTAMKIKLGQQELVYMRTLVTQPKPPLQTTAGIYGFVAASPTDPRKRVVMRILSGERGPAQQASPNE